MLLIRFLLFPIAILYDMITRLRNFLFYKNILKSYSFDIPIIAVGNLSVGGTGKSPQIEYLIRLLAPHFKLATLSRGYKRRTKGFVIARQGIDYQDIGDEPFQFFHKFKNINVAVDAHRKNGIEQLLHLPEKPEIILLDDAYQHRKIKAGLYILLTTYDELYYKDWMLPTGHLRESKSGAERAHIIIVTKCPSQLSDYEMNTIKNALKLKPQQQLFFSKIQYHEAICSDKQNIPISNIKAEKKLLLAGIAKPKFFFDYLKNENDILLTYPDHHAFSKKDIDLILEKANGMKIITTEKDYVRLMDKLPQNQLFYLPIQSEFLQNATQFDQCIIHFVQTFSSNIGASYCINHQEQRVL
nr:tetraacyldisaccharide 4'-kinase [Flavobacterium branchiophilum]